MIYRLKGLDAIHHEVLKVVQKADITVSSSYNAIINCPHFLGIRLCQPGETRLSSLDRHVCTLVLI